MTDIITLIIGIALLAVIAMLYLKLQKLTTDKSDDKSLMLLQQQLSEINKTVDARIGESNKMMQQQSDRNIKLIQGISSESNKMITDITTKLTMLEKTNQQVIGFADQLQRLQNILKNPKQRGVYGEYQLEMLLQNAFQPQQYQMQYKFNDGEIVDAVLKVGDKIIPIDSKFSLENYNRIVEETDDVQKDQLEKMFKNDLKKRIDETAKYIRPEENTMDFAFMFIPAEGIFYDLLVNKVGAIKVNTRDLLDYAINEKKVHIVSPTTFYVTLQSLWQGLRAFQVQEQTKEILKNVNVLGKHINAYDNFLQKLGNNLSTTVNSYNAAYKEFKKIDKDIVRIDGGTSMIEPTSVDRPSLE